jgi:hypothetical protein
MPRVCTSQLAKAELQVPVSVVLDSTTAGDRGQWLSQPKDSQGALGSSSWAGPQSLAPLGGKLAALGPTTPPWFITYVTIDTGFGNQQFMSHIPGNVYLHPYQSLGRAGHYPPFLLPEICAVAVWTCFPSAKITASHTPYPNQALRPKVWEVGSLICSLCNQLVTSCDTLAGPALQ